MADSDIFQKYSLNLKLHILTKFENLIIISHHSLQNIKGSFNGD